MKKILMLIGVSLFIINSFGQEAKVPANYQFKKAEDYKAYQDSAVIVAKWMVNNPLTRQKEIRKAADKFLLSWVTGAPDIHIEIRSEFTNEVTKDNSIMYSTDLMMDYIAGMFLAKINNNKIAELEAQIKGVEAMVRGYDSVVNYISIKFLDQLVKQRDKGKLEEWVKANIARSES
jgi:hypothetical protein